MNRRVFILLLVFPALLRAQETINAKAEMLGEIKVGDNALEVKYTSTEEGFYSPGGVAVDGEGSLFFIQGFSDKPLLYFKNGSWLEKPHPLNLPSNWFGPSGLAVSQQGYIGNGSRNITLNNGIYTQWYHVLKPIEYSYDQKLYRIPSGMLWEPTYKNGAVAIEYNNDGSFHVYSPAETQAWLPTQPGGFSIGDDGFLYRNGMLWSALHPKDTKLASNYIGRLASGHVIWTETLSNQARYLVIATPRGKTELTVEIPWGKSSERKDPGFYDWGLGPWGEVYYLIPPTSMWTTRPGLYGGAVYVVKDSEDIYNPAELVVVRNHLKYFGRLNADRVRLRKEPNTTSDIVGTYPNKTGFRILETGTTKETIAGQTNVWYKVRLLDGKEGWFFGAFVANLYDGPDGSPPPWPNVADW